MRETDKDESEADSGGPAPPSAAQRFHRGAMGRVLQRFLGQQKPRQEYAFLSLEQLWQQAAAIEPAIGLRLFGLFGPADWHVLAHLSQFCPDVGESLRCWQLYQRLASDMDQLQVVR